MANNYSTGGFLQKSWYMPNGQEKERRKKLVPAARDWSGIYRERKFHAEFSPEKKSMKTLRDTDDMDSDGCSYETQSSTTSHGKHQTSLDTPVAQLPTPVRTSPFASETRTGFAQSPSSLEVRDGGQKAPNYLQQRSENDVDQGLSDDTQPPPSPRVEMNIFKAEHASSSILKHVAPMDSFLAGMAEKQPQIQDDQTEDQAKSEKNWSRLRSLRAKAIRLRAQVRGLRKRLQEAEQAKSHTDENFIKYAREHEPSLLIIPRPEYTGYQSSTLDALFSALQAARNTYGPLLEEYNQLEEELDETEFQLAKIESQLYSAEPLRFLNSGPSSTVDEQEDPSDDVLLLGLASESEEDHPLYAEFLSRLGDLDLARERYMSLIHDHEKVLWARESRGRIGLDLLEDDKQFLIMFREREAELSRKITKIKNDARELRNNCIAAGIDVGEDEDELGDIQDEPVTDLLAQDLQVQTLKAATADLIPESSYSMFTLLLPQSPTEYANLDELASEIDESRKNDRCGQWILHRLRTSALEVNLLMRVFLDENKLKNIQELRMGVRSWQLCVLLFWNKETGSSQSSCTTYTRKAEHTLLSFADGTHRSPLGRTRSVTAAAFHRPSVPERAREKAFSSQSLGR